MNPEAFLSYSLRAQTHGAAITRVMAATLAAVDPYLAVTSNIRLDGTSLWIGDARYDLGYYRSVWVVGAGKAGFPMTQAVLDVLGERVSGGCVVVKDGYAPPRPGLSPIECREAAHPLPDERGIEATLRIASILRDLSSEDLVTFLCLFSHVIHEFTSVFSFYEQWARLFASMK